jgi:ABC-type transport system substrate-binding protein
MRSGWAVCFFAWLWSLMAPAESVLRRETGRISGFDPALAMDVPSVLAISKIYEGLLQYAYLERPYRVEPCLAQALPEVSADGTLYTFRLRPGIYFQDDPCFGATGGRGRELTAEDFVYSIKRVADIKTGSSGYWAFRGWIRGLDAFREASAGPGPTDYGRPVEGLSAPDRHTFRIHLTRPYPALAWILAMSYAYAVPREAVEGYGPEFASHPVGTGPFLLKTYVPNYRLEFARNPKWGRTGRLDPFPAVGKRDVVGNGADAGSPLPLLDRIEEFVIGDSSTQWLLFLSGKLDLSPVSRDNWDAVVTPEGRLSAPLAARGLVLEGAPALDTLYIGFNAEDPVVGRNRALRQAMMAAFDRERWSGFQNGRVVPAAGPIPPGIAGRDPAPTPFAFDLARARALMREAGYPEGLDPITGRRLELTLELGAGNSEMRETVEVLASFMEPLGIVIRPSFNNFPTLLRKLERRRAQLFLVSWVADYPEAGNFLQLFYGPNASPGVNRTNYRNPDFDRLYERAQATPPGPGLLELYARLEAIVKTDCPWLCLHHSMTFTVRQPWVRNYRLHDFPYGMTKYLRVDPR